MLNVLLFHIYDYSFVAHQINLENLLDQPLEDYIVIQYVKHLQDENKKNIHLDKSLERQIGERISKLIEKEISE